MKLIVFCAIITAIVVNNYPLTVNGRNFQEINADTTTPQQRMRREVDNNNKLDLQQLGSGKELKYYRTPFGSFYYPKHLKVQSERGLFADAAPIWVNTNQQEPNIIIAAIRKYFENKYSDANQMNNTV